MRLNLNLLATTFLKILVFFMLPSLGMAAINLELTQGIDASIPIAVVPFTEASDSLPTDISQVIYSDLKNSGRFRPLPLESLTDKPHHPNEVNSSSWRGVDAVLIGNAHATGARYVVEVSLANMVSAHASQKSEGLSHDQIIFTQTFTVPASKLRLLAHHISDLVYEKMLGERGIFSTKMAYVQILRNGQDPLHSVYTLEVADIDGYDSKPILKSNMPIMSPSWSPDGKKIAYVSFENKLAQIFVSNVATGERQRVTSFPGINGAPSFSPDGHQLALVLSKNGAPNIYLYHLDSHQLQPLTQGNSIDTEPSWAPDGRSILFTSNRGGGPQLYQYRLDSHNVERVSYEGDYNARGCYTPDGSAIVMIHRAEGDHFTIAKLDTKSGNVTILTKTGRNSESPSIAPNGSMVIYGTNDGRKSMLSMVSMDGQVQIALPERMGDAEQPVWSPFLNRQLS